MKLSEPLLRLSTLINNYLLALCKQIDDEPEIRTIQRAAQYMTKEQKRVCYVFWRFPSERHSTRLDMMRIFDSCEFAVVFPLN